MTSAPCLKEIDMINPNAARAWRRHAISIALVPGLSTSMLPVQAQAPQQSQETRLRVSATSHAIPAGIHATARLLIHDMPSTQGGTTRARGVAPQKTCFSTTSPRSEREAMLAQPGFQFREAQRSASI
jgi:hypothetical protein